MSREELLAGIIQVILVDVYVYGLLIATTIPAMAPAASRPPVPRDELDPPLLKSSFPGTSWATAEHATIEIAARVSAAREVVGIVRVDARV